MKNRIATLLGMLSVGVLLTGCCISHEWEEATCTEPKTCVKCEETEGEALGHEWEEATCEKPKTCKVCAETEGEALGHEWEEATCTEPKVCKICGTTEGEALGHDFSAGDCMTPKTCVTCGYTDGTMGSHDWVEADCENPAFCSVCKTTADDPLGHQWAGYPTKCEVCGKAFGENRYEDGVLYWYGAGFTLGKGYSKGNNMTKQNAVYIRNNNTFTMSVSRNVKVAKEEVEEVYRSQLPQFYTILEEKDITANGYDFHVFVVDYMETRGGYCTLYADGDTVVYMECISSDFANFEPVYMEVMNTFYLYK